MPLKAIELAVLIKEIWRCMNVGFYFFPHIFIREIARFQNDERDQYPLLC